MKVLFSILCLGLAAVGFNAAAQLTVDLSLDQQQFLPGEDLPVVVHVTNRSGQLLHLGDTGWLTFFIQADDGSVVAKKLDPPVTGLFDLNNSDMAIKHVNLGPYFALQRTGTYHVTATVHIGAWNADISSAPQKFDVIDGAELWSQSFGVSDPEMPDQPPRVRRYTLIEANYLKDQLRLYAQVSDEANGSILAVRALGNLISFSQPEAQLDRVSNLHVLCQTAATTFIHSVVSPGGKVIQKEYYDYVNTRPRLGLDNDGNIIVRGGVREPEPGQVPAVKSPDQLGR
ncbi:MAG TPA: hypothetical protein VMF08_08785 [Candidatus Sulfotelmatobacter sp.]|nr:hypothetical protein [Candidatus Sulfotelmatobacter sp.]